MRVYLIFNTFFRKFQPRFYTFFREIPGEKTHFSEFWLQKQTRPEAFSFGAGWHRFVTVCLSERFMSFTLCHF